MTHPDDAHPQELVAVQALPEPVRTQAVAAVEQLVAPGGAA